MRPAAAVFDNEAEQNVIGGVIVHPPVLANVGKLAPEDFYDPRHAAIWDAIRRLDLEQRPIDMITISDAMAQAGTFDLLKAVGGRAYFGEVMGAVVTVENIGYHANRLRLFARRRRVQAFAQRVAVEAADEAVDAEDFLDRFDRTALELAAREERTGGPRGITVILKELMKDIEVRSENRADGGISGIPTRLTKFDRMTLGLQPGDLVIIAARPSMGKTAMVLNWIRNAVEEEEPALLFSLEMKDRALVERMLVAEAEVSAQAVRAGRLDQTAWIALTRAASSLSLKPVTVIDQGEVDLHEIKTAARNWRARWPKKYEGKRGILVIDYLQLVEGSKQRSGREDDRQREVTKISRGLKLLAKELGLPVVALCQLNRNLESRGDKRPMMSDLRESGALEQDADLIAFIYREVVYDKNTDDKEAAELIIGKQRNGPTGTVKLRFDGSLQRFFDASDDDDAPPKSPRKRADDWHPFAPGEDLD